MRFLLTTTAGLALLALALAPTAQAQNRAASPPDLDSPRGAVPETLPIREARGADQDIPGRTMGHVPTRGQDTVSDQDDVTTSPRGPVLALAPALGRLDDGRDGAAPVLVLRTEQASLYPDGREPGLLAVAKASGLEATRTMTEDGRALDARPGDPVLDEALPEAEGAEASKTDAPAPEIALAAVSPNPVEQTARIAFTLPAAGTATLVLFDVRGREVATLFEGPAAAGTTAITLDATGLAAGTYIYVLDVEGQRQSRRFQVAR